MSGKEQENISKNQMLINPKKRKQSSSQDSLKEGLSQEDAARGGHLNKKLKRTPTRSDERENEMVEVSGKGEPQKYVGNKEEGKKEESEDDDFDPEELEDFLKDIEEEEDEEDEDLPVSPRELDLIMADSSMDNLQISDSKKRR